jgi:hypothetical protein
MGRRVGHVGRGRVNRGFWWRNLRERDHLEDPGVNGRITIIHIFKNGAWTELI